MGDARSVPGRDGWYGRAPRSERALGLNPSDEATLCLGKHFEQGFTISKAHFSTYGPAEQEWK